MDLRKIRLQDDRPTKRVYGFIEFPLLLQSIAKIDVGLDIAGLEGDCLAIGGDRPIQLSFVLQSDAQIVMRFRQARVKGDGLAMRGDGLVDLALVSERIAKIVVRFGKIGPE